MLSVHKSITFTHGWHWWQYTSTAQWQRQRSVWMGLEPQGLFTQTRCALPSCVVPRRKNLSQCRKMKSSVFLCWSIQKQCTRPIYICGCFSRSEKYILQVPTFLQKHKCCWHYFCVQSLSGILKIFKKALPRNNSDWKRASNSEKKFTKRMARDTQDCNPSLFPESVNRDSLDLIERCIFVINLDDAVPVSFNYQTNANANVNAKKINFRDNVSLAKQMLHGFGSNVNSCNRWFDKTMQVNINYWTQAWFICTHCYSYVRSIRLKELCRFCRFFFFWFFDYVSKNNENTPWRNVHVWKIVTNWIKGNRRVLESWILKQRDTDAK